MKNVGMWCFGEWYKGKWFPVGALLHTGDAQEGCMPLEAFHLGLLHLVVYYMLENLQIKRLCYYICGGSCYRALKYRVHH